MVNDCCKALHLRSLQMFTVPLKWSVFHLRTKCIEAELNHNLQIPSEADTGGVLEYYPKFTGKHLCQSVFFKKIAGLRTLAQVFSCEFCEIFKNTFFAEHLQATASFPYWTTFRWRYYSLLSLLKIISS